MKRFKNKLIIINALLLSVIVLYSCETKDSSLENIKLISPMGFEISSSIDKLKQDLKLLEEDYKIINIEFKENNKFNVAFIDYVDKNGIKYNCVMAKGKIKFNTDQSIKYISKNKIKINNCKKAHKKWKISCGGCDNCKVGGSIGSNGGISFQCESDCCDLIVEEI